MNVKGEWIFTYHVKMHRNSQFCYFVDDAQRSANHDFWLYSAVVSRRNSKAYNTYLWSTGAEVVSINVEWLETGDNTLCYELCLSFVIFN